MKIKMIEKIKYKEINLIMASNTNHKSIKNMNKSCVSTLRNVSLTLDDLKSLLQEKLNREKYQKYYLDQEKNKKYYLNQEIKYLELLHHNQEKLYQEELDEEKEYLDLYEEQDKRDRELEDQDLERHIEQEREYCRMKQINPDTFEYYWDIERKFRIEY